MNKPKIKTTKKINKTVKKHVAPKSAKKPVEAKVAVKPNKKAKVVDEELGETPLLEIEEDATTEDHEILKILDKKAVKPKHTSSVDYIPELERGEFDFNDA